MNRTPKLPSVILALLLITATISLLACEDESVEQSSGDPAQTTSASRGTTGGQTPSSGQTDATASSGSPTHPATESEPGEERETAASGPTPSPTPPPEFPAEAVDGSRHIYESLRDTGHIGINAPQVAQIRAEVEVLISLPEYQQVEAATTEREFQQHRGH